MELAQKLKIALKEIELATNNFHDENFIAQGGFGKVYIGELSVGGQLRTVAVKKLDRTFGQGQHEFLTEIQMLSCYKHRNLISLIGFCDENEENILVYEHAKHGSLDRYLSDSNLSWVQRLQISIGAARGFCYLHNDVGTQHRVLHRDIKSSNILLDENWEAQISDFGLSKIGLSNVEFSYLVTRACGTPGYVDPQYVKNGIVTKECDVYSFGIVLFEILSGRLAFIQKYQDERRFLGSLVQKYFEENRLHEIIHPNLKNQIKIDSLNIFSRLAYECLSENQKERPTMGEILKQLEEALELQISSKVAGLIRVGTWGRQSGGPENDWSFQIEKNHHLNRIIIDHGNVINSLIFTTLYKGVTQTSERFGGCNGGDTVSEAIFEWNEEIIAINGTIASMKDDPVSTSISSISFVTNRKTHGPFGNDGGIPFTLPWEDGSLVGFYGLASKYVDSIGVYLKAEL